jgi:hypothetical protein
MAMQQCPNGHLYDDSKNNGCPYCGGSNSINVTLPLGDNQFQPLPANAFPSTVPLENNNLQQPYQAPTPQVQNTPPRQPDVVIPPTTPISPQFAQTTYKEDIVNDKGIIEVRGWLVCLEGSKRGVDFKIHGEKNTIGRGSENDVNLDFDTSISKGVNAIIAYDNRNNKFYLYQSNSKNNIYFNNQLLLNPVEISDYDVLEIGDTKMIFRSLCNDTFTWEKEGKKAE